MPTSSGTLLDDRYELSRRLGAGGTAAVWAALDRATNTEVAVKLLHAELRLQQKNRMRFEREARVLETLDHPHIAKLLDHRLDHPTPYIVLELLVGSTLADLIGAHATPGIPMELARAMQIFEEICSAVSYAHQRGILHRDLKPGNVMVDPTKVLDFGLAKLGDGPTDQATTRGRYIGSYFYMSPEQTQGEPATTASDVFGLGCILYEVLTLRRAWARSASGGPLVAFAGERAANSYNVPPEIMSRIRSDPRPRPSTIRAELAPFDEPIARALAIEPEARFGTAAEMLETVLAIAGEGATTAVEEDDGATTAIDDDAMTVPPTVIVEERIPRWFWGLAGATGVASAALSIWLIPAEPEVVTIPAAPIGPVLTPTVRPAIEARVSPEPRAAPVETEVEEAPRPRRVRKSPRRIDRLLRRLEADPLNLELIAELGRELESASKSIGDPSKRERIERITAASVIAADLAGLRQAVRELEEAR